MIRAGHPRAQALAAAYANERRHPRAARGGIMGFDDGGLTSADDATAADNLRQIRREMVDPELQPYFGSSNSGLQESIAASQRMRRALAASGLKGFDDGGTVPTGIGGLAPSTFSQSPLEQQALSRFSSLPTEKLQELAVQLGGSGQGQVLQKVLAARRVMPNAMPQQTAGIAPPPQPLQQQKHGGDVRHRADGGDLSWEEGASLARHASGATTGFLHSIVPGRTDLIHANPPVGSFVVPADVVSGIGEGNSVSGAALLETALRKGPFGTALPDKRAPRLGIPAPPPRFTEPLMGPAAKRGGRTKGDDHVGEPTPILAAGGEFIIEPEIVKLWGNGDLKKGHNVLDAWVVSKRKEIAKKMLKLPPPRKK